MVRKAPGPPDVPLLGHGLFIQHDPIGYFTQVARRYGPVVQLRLLKRAGFLITEPELIRDVLVTRQQNFTKTPTYQRMRPLLGDGLLTSEGDIHKRHRRLLQPAFNRDSMPAYGAIMTGYAAQAAHRFVDGSELDMHREMLRLTLAIVTRALFGADVEEEARDVGEAMSGLEESFRVVALPFMAFLGRLPLPAKQRADAVLVRVRQMVELRIQEHRERPERYSDLLSILLALRYEDGAAFDDLELRDEVITLFAGGHATSALALTWAWYLLARNPECEQNLHRELDAVLGSRTPEMGDLPNLPYTANVVAEVLRFYPPVWAIGRMAKEDLELGGFAIPAGSICLMSQYLMHHNELHFPEPERFLPERWTGAFREALPKLSYFPFGAGARVCIGERFALMEIVLALATLAQRWKFRLSNDAPVKMRPRILLRPGGAVRMRVVAR